MESTSKFNLEKSIAQWKSTLYQNDSLTEDAIAELESHLLDETDELYAKGLNEEEAFFIARKRLGETDLLVSEFEKLDDNLLSFNRIRFLFIGILFTCFLTNIVETICLLSATASFYMFNNYENITITVNLIVVAISIMFLVYNRLIIVGKVKSLGIFGNIPFLIISTILSRIFYIVFCQQSEFGLGIISRAMPASYYFSEALLVFIISVALFIHFRKKKKQVLA